MRKVQLNLVRNAMVLLCIVSAPAVAQVLRIVDPEDKEIALEVNLPSMEKVGVGVRFDALFWGTNGLHLAQRYYYHCSTKEFWILALASQGGDLDSEKNLTMPASPMKSFSFHNARLTSSLARTCAAPSSSKSKAQIALGMTTNTIVIFQLRTLRSQKGVNEIWAKEVSIKKGPFLQKDGSPLLLASGDPFMTTTIDSTRGYTMVRWAFNCKDRTVGVWQTLEYDEKGATPKASPIDDKFFAAVPDTVGEVAMEFVCGLK